MSEEEFKDLAKRITTKVLEIFGTKALPKQLHTADCNRECYKEKFNEWTRGFRAMHLKRKFIFLMK